MRYTPARRRGDRQDIPAPVGGASGAGSLLPLAQNNRRYSSLLILYCWGRSGYDTDDGTEHFLDLRRTV